LWAAAGNKDGGKHSLAESFQDSSRAQGLEESFNERWAEPKRKEEEGEQSKDSNN